jgi:hypothetical protein
LRADDWIEGADRGDVDVWGADWAGFRLKLLTHLGAFNDRQWRPMDAAVAWLAQRDPEMLGAQFRAATARATEVSGDARASRAAAIAEVVGVTLRTAGVWFGLIETTAQPRQPLAMRLTALGAALAAGQAIPLDAPGPRPALDVTAEGDVLLRDPSPLRVWSLSAFADLAELGEASRYRLTEPSVRRALAAGFDTGQISQFLKKESGRELPAAVIASLATWGKSARRVRMSRAVVISADSADEAIELERVAAVAGVPARRFGEILIVEAEASDDQVIAVLRANGYVILEEPKATRRKG